MFIHTSWDFYGIRFLLGIVESGFFPGVILYLTFWFNSRYRAQMVAVFMTAIPLSAFIFGPISTWLMGRLDNVWGFAWLAMALCAGSAAFFVGWSRLADLLRRRTGNNQVAEP